MACWVIRVVENVELAPTVEAVVSGEARVMMKAKVEDEYKKQLHLEDEQEWSLYYPRLIMMRSLINQSIYDQLKSFRVS